MQPAAVTAVEFEEVVRLHDHIVELEECQPLFPALLIALGGKHTVDSEMCADIAQKFNIIETAQPISIIHHNRTVLCKVDEARDLFLEALAVMANGLVGHDFAHIRASGRIADGSRAAAHKTNGAMPRLLQMRHRHQGNKMTGVKAVRSRIKTNVKSDRSFRHEFTQRLFIRALCKKTSFL